MDSQGVLFLHEWNAKMITHHYHWLFVSQMEGIKVMSSDNADDKVKEDCCPGQPFITFMNEVSISLQNKKPGFIIYLAMCS